MSVEDFHFAPYIVESTASNPDLAVFFRHQATYILEAAAVNAAESVFINSHNNYVLFGRDTPADLSLRHTALYGVFSSASAGDQLQVTATGPYLLTGGKQNLTPFLKVPNVTFYEIFT